MNQFSGDGNLGAAPVLKSVKVGSEQRSVLELRIAFDNYVVTEQNEGEVKYEEQGSFWLSASLWGKRAERAAKVLVKGARVHVTGKLVQQDWTDKESGEERTALVLQADDVYLSTVRVDAVQFAEKKAA